MEDSTQLCITYGGPDIASLGMNARHLAGAMVATARFVDVAARTLHGDECRVDVSVSELRAENDCEIGFVLYLKGPAEDESRRARLASTVAGEGGFVRLSSWLRGQGVSRVDAVDGGPDRRARTRVHTDRGYFDALGSAWVLYREADVRDAFDQLLRPLQAPGVDFASFAHCRDEEGASAPTRFKSSGALAAVS